VVHEANVESEEHGLVAKGEGWYVVNARDVRWRYAEGRGAVCDIEGDVDWPQFGANLFVLGPGEPMAMYHWEADQEGFFVLSGEALLIVEGEERPLRQWDYVHCPPGTNHIVVGAGSGPCAVLALGARIDSVREEGWGGYPVDEAALRHGAGVEEETTDAKVAYAPVGRRQPTRFREEWLPS
jgi:quercetin dioxygenase-like cupin family protein